MIGLAPLATEPLHLDPRQPVAAALRGGKRLIVDLGGKKIGSRVAMVGEQLRCFRNRLLP